MKRTVAVLATVLILITANAWSATVSLAPIGDVTTWPGTTYRWMDIADNLYASTYQQAKPYPYDSASVSLTYQATAATFTGTLNAAGLKPNFAYQMKLVGKPDVNNWANEQIGYAGRWWRQQPTPGNSSDADYNAHKNDPGYVYQGYLLFDFFVTDQQGNASVTFAADSSFHVLWATPDSTGPGTGHRSHGVNDGPVRYTDFTASPLTNSVAYGVDYGAARVGIYGEHEGGRALPGTLALTPGDYNCQFILTEESFHQSGLGGYWAGAMGADSVEFTIVPVPPTFLLLGTGLLGLLGLRWKRARAS